MSNPQYHTILSMRPLLFLVFLIGIFLAPSAVMAQRNTKVKGTVIDAETKEPLPFVNIAIGDNIGTTTDFKGKYTIASKWAKGTISASFMGYETQEKTLILGENQTIDFELSSASIKVDEVTVVAKGRYRNKENPAVVLIRKVIENKDNNRIKGFDYYSYNKYEKLQLDLNNITQEFMDQKAFKKFSFMWNYVDTSEINGKPYLPLYLTEKKSNVYYRSSPKGTKEIVYGEKTVGFEEFMDEEGLDYFLEKIYQDIDVYDNSILLMEKQFVSPISSIAPGIYKYFLLDTVDIDGAPYVQLAFQPRNSAELAFRGNMYISLDSSFAVKKIKMGITRSANINFVSDLQIVQEFNHKENQGWQLTKDQLTIDYNFLSQKMGMYGKKTVSYKDITVNVPPPDSIVNWGTAVEIAEDAKEKSDSFWEEQRHEKLDDNEAGVYKMTKDLKELPAFKRAMNLIFFILSGFYELGPIDIGPLWNAVSLNSVEHWRFRITARTNKKMSEKYQAEGFVAYGLDNRFDKRWKFGIGNSFFFSRRPYHQIDVEFQRDIQMPGQALLLANEDNIFLSARTGLANLMIYYDSYRINYLKEFGFGLTVGVNLEHKRRQAAGALRFNPVDAQVAAPKEIVVNEVGISLKYAPNSKFYEGRSRRTVIKSKYPIFDLSYSYNIPNLLGSKYEYHKIGASIFKRFYMGLVGFGDSRIEGGYMIGKVPFPLMFIHRGNQTFFHDPNTFDMMNWFEFVSDKFVSVDYFHHFNGFIFNRVPLLKKLKWRMTTGVKAVWGGVSKSNNPQFTNNKDIIFNFPERDKKDKDGEYVLDDNGDRVTEQLTYTLEKMPYVEAHIGVENIFKILSLNLTKRFTHLNNTNPQFIGSLKGWGLKLRVAIRF